MQYSKINPSALMVLNEITRCLDTTITAFTEPYIVRWDEEDLEALKILKEKWRQKKMIRILKSKKYIKLTRKANKLELQLTNKGLIIKLFEIIKEKEELLPEGGVCVVSFDIPEPARKVRRTFRTLLEESGFVLRHKSVWQTRHDVSQELRLIIKKLKIERWVQIYKAELAN